MIRTDLDYASYFPLSPEIRRWGLGVTGAGFARITAGSPYPPRRHPSDHYFDWKHGRILEGLQVLLISRGRGVLETAATGCKQVTAGMAFLLLPRVWHRYRPEVTTGWDESWVEMTGPVVENLLRDDAFPPGAILKPDALAAGLEAVFQEIHSQARECPGGFQPELSASALRVLALCSRIESRQSSRSRLESTMRKAEQYFAAHQSEPVDIEALARRLGMAYSHFRRAFRSHTGLAPWQYIIHLRLARARRLLASSDATLEEVAARVGFSSAFHLSLTFKRAFGQSPIHWKRALHVKQRKVPLLRNQRIISE